jgi:hypothetical protein
MKTIIKTLVLYLLLLFSNTFIFAQAPFDPGQDPGAVPISDYIIPMLLIGIVIGYRLLKQKKLIAK